MRRILSPRFLGSVVFLLWFAVGVLSQDANQINTSKTNNISANCSDMKIIKRLCKLIVECVKPNETLASPDDTGKSDSSVCKAKCVRSTPASQPAYQSPIKASNPISPLPSSESPIDSNANNLDVNQNPNSNGGRPDDDSQDFDASDSSVEINGNPNSQTGSNSEVNDVVGADTDSISESNPPSSSPLQPTGDSQRTPQPTVPNVVNNGTMSPAARTATESGSNSANLNSTSNSISSPVSLAANPVAPSNSTAATVSDGNISVSMSRLNSTNNTIPMEINYKTTSNNGTITSYSFKFLMITKPNVSAKFISGTVNPPANSQEQNRKSSSGNPVAATTNLKSPGAPIANRTTNANALKRPIAAPGHHLVNLCNAVRPFNDFDFKTLNDKNKKPPQYYCGCDAPFVFDEVVF